VKLANLKRLPSAIALSAVAISCLILATGTCSAQQPYLGIYFDEYGYWSRDFRVFESPMIFDGYLILYNTDLYVTAVEFRLEIPSNIAVFDVEYNDNYSISIGNVQSGISIAFWPPLDVGTERCILCKYTFFAMDNCGAGLDDGMGSPIIVSPHTDSGYLRGTYYPDHELFDITGEMSFLCSDHWPPVLSDVQVNSPRSVRAWFNQCVWNWLGYDDSFILYTTAEPHDTIEVTSALKNVPYDVSGVDFLVYFESPMQEGVSYTLEAFACCECNGCATSTRSFVYEGGFADIPDVVVTHWIDYNFGIWETPFDLAIANGCNEVELDYEVRNLGMAACGPFLVRIKAGPRDGSEDITVWSDSCSGLDVDGTFGGTVSVIVPWIPSLLGYLWFEADHPDWIAEVNEENNARFYWFNNYRPEIISIEDVPDDSGGQVELSFHGSWLDIESPMEGDIYQIMRQDRATGEWEEVHQLEARSYTIYTFVVPTEIDSSDASESYWTTFMVDYPRSLYAMSSSCPDSGYSVNDLVPTAALLLASSVETTGGSILLRWSFTESPDFREFSVSRAVLDGTYQNIGSLPVSPGEYSFEFEDISAEPAVKYIYRVEYTDGDETHILFETEPAGLPPRPFALHQNHPNPFNPSTEIGFSLPVPSTVTLDIFDVSGKRIRRLLEESRPAGNHSVHWDGLDDNGSRAISGVYFYRLTAGINTHSRKMILLR
jgi:hypothetical protein